MKKYLAPIIVGLLFCGLCIIALIVVKSDKSDNSSDKATDKSLIQNDTDNKTNDTSIVQTRSKKTDKNEALYENMLLQRWFPEVNQEDSVKIWNELSEKESFLYTLNRSRN